ncbi:ESX-1 secretion-associated protein EspF [Mycobacterium uberis]|uniref:ESX-1 secretion-associated protein EspF n=1 Tax=Mycobacterium uberis TaxID=2162698 RepID=A0A3E1HLM7_9MYCO|nr:ESX-1 secretion-associated protein [Mycobacterium uberis]RFD27189.1 ESX-1 secretion-associated protein EspF [Mycobacterium uberis]
MTGMLSVIPSWLQTLGGMQNTIASDVKTATDKVTGISQRVSQTHGSYTSQFNDVLATLETTRSQAGIGVAGVSSSLGSSLLQAAAAYLNTDIFSGQKLDKTVNM